MTQSPDLLRPAISNNLVGNKAYHLASCYYEAMLRYYNACNTAYVLTTQVNAVSHAVALEINRATYESTIAARDAQGYWLEFIDALSNSVILDTDNLVNKWYEALSVTIVFPDGMAISYGYAGKATIKLGGLPMGTFVYVNGEAFEMGDHGFYQLEPNVHDAYRVTNLINDVKV